MGNITQVHFKDGQECCYNITGLEQWDKGQKLEISGLDNVEEYVEVHFSLQQYCGTAKRMLGKMVDGILHTYIPAFIMEGPEYICAGAGTYSAYAWVYVSDEESAETIRKMEFVIKARAKPEEYVTPEDLDFLEQLEVEMKNKLDKSGHAPNKILGTDAEGNVIAKDAEVEVDLSGYVKNTDYASSEKAGIVKVISNQGIEMDGEVISISPANRQTIDEKASYKMPIVPAHLDYAVMKALSDSKYAWTEEEKSNSRNLLGTTGEDQLLQFAIKPTTDKAPFHNIQDSAEYKVLDIGMEGKTEQDTTSGKNLYSGGDISGTMLTEQIVKINPVPAGKYTISANVKSSDTDESKNLVVLKYGNDTVVNFFINRGNRTSYNFETSQNVDGIVLYASTNSATSEGDTFSFTDIQIESGSVATSYEPYTGKQPSPNPEYPQEIVNAGEIYNLLNPGELENGLLLDENGSISTAGTYGDVYRIFKQTLPAGTYTLFINGAKISITRMILDGNFNVLNATVPSYTFTVAKKSEVTICFRKEDSSAFDGTEEIQLNAGSVPKPYKPYTGRYEIECKVVNKNLAIGEAGYRPNYYIPLKAGTTVVCSGEETWTDSVFECYYIDGTKQYFPTALVNGRKQGSCILTKDLSHVMFRGMIYEPQIEIGSLTDYTPHQSQNIIITPPVPLTKWDKLVKRDGKWYWEYRQLHFSVDGNSGWDMYTQLRGFLAKVLPEVMNRRSGYCNQLTVDDDPYGSSSENGCWLGVNNHFLYVLKSDYYDDNLEDYGLANWKAHLNENPLEIWIYSDKSELVPLMPEEQTLLNNLETYYGVTNIYNDQGCPMWLTYVADTKLYIDNKILSIQTAMI